MKDKKLLEKKERLLRRQRKTRLKMLGTKVCPRLVVVKSLKHTFCQLVDDKANKVLLGMTAPPLKGANKTERARLLGKKLGKLLLRKKIQKIVFDRHGYKFQGRIKALAEALQKQGIKF